MNAKSALRPFSSNFFYYRRCPGHFNLHLRQNCHSWSKSVEDIESDFLHQKKKKLLIEKKYLIFFLNKNFFENFEKKI